MVDCVSLETSLSSRQRRATQEVNTMNSRGRIVALLTIVLIGAVWAGQNSHAQDQPEAIATDLSQIKVRPDGAGGAQIDQDVKAVEMWSCTGGGLCTCGSAEPTGCAPLDCARDCDDMIPNCAGDFECTDECSFGGGCCGGVCTMITF
jgi:hypothetical protein